MASMIDRVRPGGPGESLKFAFTTAAGTFQLIRAVTALQNNVARYVSVKVTADAHLVFGGPGVGAPTAADALFQPGDGWQDMILMPEDNGLRVIGDTASGSVYIWLSGR